MRWTAVARYACARASEEMYAVTTAHYRQDEAELRSVDMHWRRGGIARRALHHLHQGEDPDTFHRGVLPLRGS